LPDWAYDNLVKIGGLVRNLLAWILLLLIKLDFLFQTDVLLYSIWLPSLFIVCHMFTHL
jgi:hypothetical protein